MPFLYKASLLNKETPLYSVGLNKTILLVGLGNVGKKFEGTRHNIGFDSLDLFTATNEFEAWHEKKDLKSFITSATLGDTRVIAIKPTTFMNLSGEAVAAVMTFYKLPITSVVTLYDELDIPFGQIRTRVGGSSAGHNGVQSVIDAIGENFGRVRIGIGPKTPEEIDIADFVLQKFKKDQQPNLRIITNEVIAILTEFIFGGQVLAHETRNIID